MSVIQKRGKRWRVVVQAGRDPLTGKRLQLSAAVETEREAVRVERQLRLDAERSATSRARLAEVAELWWSCRPGLAPTTLVNYRDNLDNHILSLLGDKTMGEIRPRLVAIFLGHLGKKGLAPGTVRKVRTVLSAVMSFAVAMEYVESNPVMKVPPPTGPASERVGPTVEETARILLAAEQVDPDLLAYLWVAAEEGGRRGETLGLRWRDVDLVNGTITIERTISIGDDGVQERARTKSGGSRTLAVSRGTVCQLAALRERTEGLLSEAAGTRVSLGGDALVFSGGGSRRNPLDGKPWRPDSTGRHRLQVHRRRAWVRAALA
jgi:integrase